MILRVLVVENGQGQTEKLAPLVKELQHELSGKTSDLKKALAMRMEFEPDVVLMDLDGFGSRAMPSCREMVSKRRLPIVIVTEEPDQELAALAVQAGVYAYLIKPLDAGILGPALELAYLTYQKEATLEHQLIDLKKELADRILISRAVGYFIDHHGLSEKEALETLNSEALLHDRTPAEQAETIIAKVK